MKYLILLIVVVLISCVGPTKTQQIAEESQEKFQETPSQEVTIIETEGVIVEDKTVVIPDEQTKKVRSKKEKVALVATGRMIPEGTIYNLERAAIATTDFKGKLLVLDFWATWCGPCLREAPLFQRLATKYKDSPVTFVGVSIDENFDHWKRHVEKKNWIDNQYWLGVQDDQDFFSFAYSEMDFDGDKMILMGVPRYVFVAPNGEILNSSAAKPSNPKFEEELKRYLVMEK